MNTTSSNPGAGAVPSADRTAVGFPPKKILVPLDLSARALKALQHAQALARRFGSELHLVHITEPLVYPTDLGYAPVVSGDLETELQEGSRERLAAVVEAVRQAGFTVSGRLQVGRPHTEIVAAAADFGADLVVLTTHGFTGLKHVLLGSVAERVVRHAPCPVWVVRDPEREPASTEGGVGAGDKAKETPDVLGLQRVVVATDFSEASRAALEYAAALAQVFRAGLLLVHVTELPYVEANLADVDTRVFEETTRQQAEEQLSKLVQAHQAAGLSVESRLVVGAAWHETVELARETGAGLIVAGTHGYTGLKHALLGSTAERLVRHAPCPVLVVRRRGEMA
jgi:nucleotide-binding universal stress UspA family protein